MAETSAGARWAARLVGAAYPDYRGVLPDGPTPVRAVVDRAELRAALRRSAGFDAVDHTVALVATPAGDGPGSLTVAARGRETGDAVSELEAEVVGGPLTVHLNAGLLDGLLRALADGAGRARAAIADAGVRDPAGGRDRPALPAHALPAGAGPRGGHRRRAGREHRKCPVLARRRGAVGLGGVTPAPRPRSPSACRRGGRDRPRGRCRALSRFKGAASSATMDRRGPVVRAGRGRGIGAPRGTISAPGHALSQSSDPPSATELPRSHPGCPDVGSMTRPARTDALSGGDAVRAMPSVRDGELTLAGGTPPGTIAVDAAAWWAWLGAADAASFRVEVDGERFTARREQKPGGWYWYGYRRRDGTLRKVYLGRTADLTLARLTSAAASLARAAGGNAMAAGRQVTGGSGDTASPPLLTTKLFAPRARPDLVARPRLLARLDAGLATGALTLLCAPAGCGKTTLLAAWSRCLRARSPGCRSTTATRTPACFCATSSPPSRPSRPGCGRTAPDAARVARNRRPLPTLLTPLLNDLAARAGGGLLVLDDYHVIDAPAIHEALAFLLDHLPPHAAPGDRHAATTRRCRWRGCARAAS